MNFPESWVQQNLEILNIHYIMDVEVVLDVWKILQIANAYTIIPFSKCILWCLMAIAHAHAREA